MKETSPQKNPFSKVFLGSITLIVILIGVLLVLSGLGKINSTENIILDAGRTQITGWLLIVSGIVALVWFVTRRSNTPPTLAFVTGIERGLIEWNVQDDALSVRQRAINLVLASFLGLFFELALIRWLGTEIKVFAYLKNIVLIAAFLGLGLGYFTSRRPANTFPLFLPLATALIASVALGVAFGIWARIIVPSSEQLVLLGSSFAATRTAPLFLQVLGWLPFYLVTLFYFVFIALVFVPLGQYTGKCMRAFEPIPGYALNLAASLAGTLAFTALSFAWLPPTVWFAIAAVAAMLQLGAIGRPVWRWNIAFGLALVVLFVIMPVQPGKLVWSPYNQIVVSPLTVADNNGREVPWGYQLSVGEYYYYQDLADLSAKFFQDHPDLPEVLRYSEYEVPYQFAHPSQILILGAGTGNDVAAALRYGAKNIDAVEIDPAILRAGQDFHPEHPYDNAGVHLIANDARAYIKQTDKQYDLVLFGLLDSYQVISAFGAVRLDNFVYTIEGMRDAYARVKQDGILATTFELYEPWIGQRISGVLETATGQKPMIIHAHHGTVFLIRKGTPLTITERERAIAQLANQVDAVTLDQGEVPLTTDDWPFLYLRDRSMPFAYLTMLPILGLVSFWLIRWIGATDLQLHWHFFFLGAGFLLMEVRVIGQVALLFGSTWIVNVVAIAAILFMAILANSLVAVKRFSSIRIWGILLLVSLAASSLIPSSTFLVLGQGLGGTLAALLLALPVFFASTVFSISFRQTGAVDTALASNLAGALLGGFIEYVSIIGGIGSLAWIAAALYLFALLAEKK